MILILQLEPQGRYFMNVFQFNQFAIVPRLPHIELSQLLLIHLNEDAAALVPLTEPHAHGRKAFEMMFGSIDAGPSALQVVDDGGCGGNAGQGGGGDGAR